MSTRSKRAYAGVDKLRKLMRKLDPETTQGVKDVLKDGADAIQFSMLMGAPVDEGDMARSIAVKLGRDGMTAYIGAGADRANIVKSGFGAVTAKYTKSGALTSATIKDKDALFQLYKSHWIEHGTSARGNHPGQRPRPFINSAYDAHADRIQAEMSKAIDEALRIAANG